MNLILTSTDWLALLLHCFLMSLLSIGGVITVAPDMHRYLVDEQRWLVDSQFTTSMALAQAAPGPNVLFMALLGWHVGLNAGAALGAGHLVWAYALLGALTTMLGILLPSTVLTFVAGRWAHQNRHLRAVRAFKQGMAPIGIALLMATALVLAKGHGDLSRDWSLWLLALATALMAWRTQVHLLWLLGCGALLGWFGWV